MSNPPNSLTLRRGPEVAKVSLLFRASKMPSLVLAFAQTPATPPPFPGPLMSSGDLAFDDQGVLWGTATPGFQTDRLVRLVPGGVGTEIGDIGRSFIFGLVFADGALYGTGGRLYEIDRTDASRISEGGGMSNVEGAAFLASVPEPAVPWLLLAGVVGLRGILQRSIPPEEGLR